MDELLQELALGIAQVRYWELRKRYNQMLGRMEQAFPQRKVECADDPGYAEMIPAQVQGFLIDPESEKIAREWDDFCKEHEDWTFNLFDPCDIAAMFTDDIEEWEV